MNAYRLAALLAVFLVTGVLTSMLTAEDPQWWQENLSALGMSSDASGVAFNVTLIVAGVVVTTLAGYSTRTLDATAGTASARRRVRQLEGGIILIGVLLACVGLFPVDEQFWLHTRGSVRHGGGIRIPDCPHAFAGSRDPGHFQCAGAGVPGGHRLRRPDVLPVRLLQPHRGRAHCRLAGLWLADRPDPQPGRRRRRPARREPAGPPACPAHRQRKPAGCHRSGRAVYAKPDEPTSRTGHEEIAAEPPRSGADRGPAPFLRPALAAGRPDRRA